MSGNTHHNAAFFTLICGLFNALAITVFPYKPKTTKSLQFVWTYTANWIIRSTEFKLFCHKTLI